MKARRLILKGSLAVALALWLASATEACMPNEAFAQQDEEEGGSLPDLDGIWAQQAVTTTVSSVPIVGEVVSRTVAVQRVRVQQEEAELTLKTEVCSLSIDSSVDSVRTELSERFVRALEPQVRPARITEKDGTYYLRAPRSVEVIGARLRAPQSEHLPDEPDDLQVHDQDQDGHPGMTVEVRGLIDGELYIVQRGWDELRGKIDQADQISGRIEWGQEQVVLDSTSIFLTSSPESKPHPDPDKSYFRMKRVSDDATCASLAGEFS